MPTNILQMDLHLKNVVITDTVTLKKLLLSYVGVQIFLMVLNLQGTYSSAFPDQRKLKPCYSNAW